jgi:hypothetical protein
VKKWRAVSSVDPSWAATAGEAENRVGWMASTGLELIISGIRDDDLQVWQGNP